VFNLAVLACGVLRETTKKVVNFLRGKIAPLRENSGYALLIGSGMHQLTFSVILHHNTKTQKNYFFENVRKRKWAQFKSTPKLC